MKRTNVFVIAELVLILLLVPAVLSVLTTNITLKNSGIVSLDPTSNPADYYISLSGGITHVSDGYSSSSPTLAFAHAFGLVKDGGTIYVGGGTYVATWEYTYQADGAPLYSYFAMENCTNVVVNFHPNAILTIPDGGRSSVFIVWYCTNITLNNLQIDGNAPNQIVTQATDGICIWDSSNVIVDSATIYNCRTYGFATGNNYPIQTMPNGIINSKLYNCYWNGIILASNDYAVGNYAYNNEVYNCSDVGISNWGGINIRILNNNIHDINGTCGWAGEGTGSHYGIANEGGKYGVYANNIITNCGLGIALGTGNAEWGTLVKDNTIINCDQGITCWDNGFNTITRNTVINWGLGQAWGIGVANGTNNIVSFNTLINNRLSLSQAMIVEGAWNTAICSNTITVPLGTACGIDVGTSSSGGTPAIDTLIAWNNIQASYGIITESNNALNTKINQNNLVNCTFPISDGGIGTIVDPASSDTNRLFFNNNYDGSSSGCTTYSNTIQIVLSLSSYQILNIDGVDLTTSQTVTMNKDHFVYVYFDYSI